LGSSPDSMMKRSKKVVGIQAFHTPILNTGISVITIPAF
jgi:hypothetical protein